MSRARAIEGALSEVRGERDAAQARVADLARLMLDTADKLEEFGNEEPRAVAVTLRRAASSTNMITRLGQLLEGDR